MKQEQPRVMAYRLAKEIDNATLEHISGGNAQMTTRMTTKMTLIPGGPDMTYDTQSDAI